MSKAGTSDNRIETLDVLRGAAALMVTWWHVFNHDVRYFHSDVIQTVAAFIAANGRLGVYIFFVISGFVIPLSAVGGARAIAYWPALAKRMVRLYPPFFASLVLASALLLAATNVPGFAGSSAQIAPSDFVLNGLYLAPLFDIPWINPVYWTLLVEVQYYLLIYLVLRYIDLCRPTLLALGAAVVALLPLTLESYSLIFDFTDCFALGFLAFLVFDGRLAPRHGVAASVVAVAIILVDKGPLSAFLATITALLCVKRGPAPRLLVALGTISYALYLTHYFVGTKALRLLLRFVPENDAGVALAYLLAVLACIVAATLFYFAVERPAIGWARRISARRGLAPPPEPASSTLQDDASPCGPP